jgi:peptidoglycan/xylan/chitin deacetylase (PgdA/CDA1 family)
MLPIGFRRFLVEGQAGQEVALAVTAPYDHVLLSVVGRADGEVLVSVRSEVTAWQGVLPATGAYEVNLASLAGSETTFELEIALGEAPAATPAPSPPPPPPAGSGPVLYLTFDDGPAAPSWTPQVLEVLGRHEARATFFVLGQLAKRYPELIEAEVQAGHAVANHTFDHQTLDGMGRAAFFEEIQDTEAVLGAAGRRCLRPPYGATDAYTRAYAAELGYSLVMWDIDTRDWARPGAEAIAATVIEEARPGAVVLFHDGGGDRAQTVEALEMVLGKLSEEGYRFEVVCP